MITERCISRVQRISKRGSRFFLLDAPPTYITMHMQPREQTNRDNSARRHIALTRRLICKRLCSTYCVPLSF